MKGELQMNLDDERNYQHLLDQIGQQLEILLMDILLASINRLKYDYERAGLKSQHETEDIDF
jgi:hypothetical protein